MEPININVFDLNSLNFFYKYIKFDKKLTLTRIKQFREGTLKCHFLEQKY